MLTMAMPKRNAKGKFVKGSKTRTVTKVVKAARRTRRGIPFKSLIKAVAYGLGASIGGYYVGRALGRPVVAELGQRGGAVLASRWGWKGQAAYQIADALFDRGIVQRRLGLSGLQSGTVATI